MRLGLSLVSTMIRFELRLLIFLMGRYGSVVAAQLLRDPKTSISIGPVIFIDPVSFLLHLPDVAYNFVRLSTMYSTSRSH